MAAPKSTPQRKPAPARTPTPAPAPAPQRSGAAVGLTVFTAIVMMIAGFYSIMTGLVAVINDTFFVAGENYIFQFDLTTWGWIHILLGFGVAVAGFGLFAGAVWARTVGVVLAIASAIANFMFIPQAPIWAIAVIVLDMFIIWALTTHGRDITE